MHIGFDFVVRNLLPVAYWLRFRLKIYSFAHLWFIRNSWGSRGMYQSVNDPLLFKCPYYCPTSHAKSYTSKFFKQSHSFISSKNRRMFKYFIVLIYILPRHVKSCLLSSSFGWASEKGFYVLKEFYCAPWKIFNRWHL